MIGNLPKKAVALAACSIFAGCVSSPAPENMARNTAQTAPADLQLACASAAATKFGGDNASILPVSSAAVDGGRYQIILDSRGQRSTCLIDSTGAVLSLEKV
ncbi:hypothetical protein [Phyllobacterium endophyticum]|uniref:hypothetical protein n=1 Tax=Phyllobacterium endophyticum TaxID=1149773 RepID=UPI0011C74C5D|nr:hypothetical protein [Phyllobacterium endophyticum]TXR48779.1 hypothetical protein FVA77_12560 [Phyllobacterium endophyticum]